MIGVNVLVLTPALVTLAKMRLRVVVRVVVVVVVIVVVAAAVVGVAVVPVVVVILSCWWLLRLSLFWSSLRYCRGRRCGFVAVVVVVVVIVVVLRLLVIVPFASSAGLDEGRYCPGRCKNTGTTSRLDMQVEKAS